MNTLFRRGRGKYSQNGKKIDIFMHQRNTFLENCTRCDWNRGGAISHPLFLKFSITGVKWDTCRVICEWKTFEPWCNKYKKAVWRMCLALYKLRVSTVRRVRMGMQDRSVHAAICYWNQLAFWSSLSLRPDYSKGCFLFHCFKFLDILEVPFFSIL